MYAKKTIGKTIPKRYKFRLDLDSYDDAITITDDGDLFLKMIRL